MKDKDNKKKKTKLIRVGLHSNPGASRMVPSCSWAPDPSGHHGIKCPAALVITFHQRTRNMYLQFYYSTSRSDQQEKHQIENLRQIYIEIEDVRLSQASYFTVLLSKTRQILVQSLKRSWGKP
uniref:Uncharacterized protein n=1 Tax=Opuntia streptacantha TaxID=393608 RepID=A0A7C8ZMM3_OPUST